MGKVEGLNRSQVNTSEKDFGKSKSRNTLRERSRLPNMAGTHGVVLGEGDILIE